MSVEKPRSNLTRDRVLHAAVELADRMGMGAFTMRRLADALDVKPMTIYHHVPGKEEIIDGMVDMVFGEIELPAVDQDWKTAIRARYVSAREVLNRHPWAPPLMESRTNPGPATLRHHDAVVGCFRRGLSLQMTGHAYAILDSYLYGFALEEASLPAGGGAEIAQVAEAMVTAMPADEYPHLAELADGHILQPGYSFGASFEFGLDLILDAIERTVPGSA